MRLIFMGYHNIGYACLQVLIDLCRQLGDEIVAVVTHADDPNENRWFASVRDLAFENYLPLYQPRDPNDPEFVAAMRALKPDFLFSCYYRLMLKRPLLEAPGLGALNLHGSLLPRYRGRCPLNWVLVNGETRNRRHACITWRKGQTGATSLGRNAWPSNPEDTALTLFARMTAAAGALMRETYPLLRAGAAPSAPQDQSQASYFGGRGPEDGLISWDKEAMAVYNLVRAVTHPYPGAFTHLRGKGAKKARNFTSGPAKRWQHQRIPRPQTPVPGGRDWWRPRCRERGCW